MDSKLETPQEMVAKFKGKALNFTVILRQVENKNMTQGGVDLTAVVDKNEKIKKGIVVSIGTSCPQEDVKVGDEVLFDQYKDSPLTYDGIEYVLMSYSDLIHVL